MQSLKEYILGESQSKDETVTKIKRILENGKNNRSIQYRYDGVATINIKTTPQITIIIRDDGSFRAYRDGEVLVNNNDPDPFESLWHIVWKF